jgi:hypothetical protein
MKKALISPNEEVSYISDWTKKVPFQPIYTTIPNAERVAEVLDTTFEVAPPLFWLDCADNIVADQWYYDSQTLEFVVVPAPAPPPEPVQPVTEGAQTL